MWVAYMSVEALDITNNSLEEFVLELLDLPLKGPMLISLGQDIAKEVTKRFLFTISLLDVTIQDGGKKKRSNVCFFYFSLDSWLGSS